MHAKYLRRLYHAQAAEVAELDDLRLARIEPSQRGERVLKGHQRGRFRGREDERFVQRQIRHAAAALPPAPLARVIHQDVAHQPGGHAEELCPALPIHLRMIHQLEIGFVDQRGGLQGMAGALLAHVAVGDAPQFAFHERDQPVQTLLVPGPPAEEQFGYRLSSPRLQTFFLVGCVR